MRGGERSHRISTQIGRIRGNDGNAGWPDHRAHQREYKYYLLVVSIVVLCIASRSTGTYSDSCI
eukprot:COSAG05_NODE_116_length_17986_cov_348.987534_20_plen_64_part_00